MSTAESRLQKAQERTAKLEAELSSLHGERDRIEALMAQRVERDACGDDGEGYSAKDHERDWASLEKVRVAIHKSSMTVDALKGLLPNLTKAQLEEQLAAVTEKMKPGRRAADELANRLAATIADLVQLVDEIPAHCAVHQKLFSEYQRLYGQLHEGVNVANQGEQLLPSEVASTFDMRAFKEWIAVVYRAGLETLPLSTRARARKAKAA